MLVEEIKKEEMANVEKEPENTEHREDIEEMNESGQEEDMQSELAEYKARAEEYLHLLQRVQADFDNFRKRTLHEREEWAKYCSMRLATNLLPVLDNFERALHSGGDDITKFMEGMELIYRQLKDILEKEGVKAMETVGRDFDPNFHEAVMHEPSKEHPDNTIIEEFQKGYLLADRVLRPAMVKVAKS